MDDIYKRLQRLEDKQYYSERFLWLVVIFAGAGIGYLLYFGLTH